MGHVLQDSDATIIHHFADPASLLYPHFSAGFFISLSLLHRYVVVYYQIAIRSVSVKKNYKSKLILEYLLKISYSPYKL